MKFPKRFILTKDYEFPKARSCYIPLAYLTQKKGQVFKIDRKNSINTICYDTKDHSAFIQYHTSEGINLLKKLIKEKVIIPF